MTPGTGGSYFLLIKIELQRGQSGDSCCFTMVIQGRSAEAVVIQVAVSYIGVENFAMIYDRCAGEPADADAAPGAAGSPVRCHLRGNMIADNTLLRLHHSHISADRHSASGRDSATMMTLDRISRWKSGRNTCKMLTWNSRMNRLAAPR